MNHEIEQILQQISVYLPDGRIVQAVIIVIAAVLLSRLVSLLIDTTDGPGANDLVRKVLWAWARCEVNLSAHGRDNELADIRLEWGRELRDLLNEGDE